MFASGIEIVGSAERVFVPNGRDYHPCVEAFQETYGVEVPEFHEKQLVVSAGNQEFVRVKSKDVPELVAAGYGAIGLTGTDVCGERIDTSRSNLVYKSIGAQMCTFDVLAPAADFETVLEQMRGDGEPLVVATGLPRLLGKIIAEQELNLTFAPITLSGSIEAAIRLGLAKAVADLVQTGMSAKANSLVRVATLAGIEPALVWRDAGKSYVPSVTTGAIRRIDTTLDLRNSQVDDPTITSYTLERLRDPNMAGKKLGEEAAEVLMAAFESSPEDCEAEIADLIYAALIVSRGRNKPVRLENIVRILVGRNQA